MKQVMIVFEIPDDEIVDHEVVPKLSHCRIKEGSGADMICSTPVKIIDDPKLMADILSTLDRQGINWRPKGYREEIL